jgi:hypothetical protein
MKRPPWPCLLHWPSWRQRVCRTPISRSGTFRTTPLRSSFPSGSNLRLHLRSGEFRVIGRDGNGIAVHFSAGATLTAPATLPFASGAWAMMATFASLVGQEQSEGHHRSPQFSHALCHARGRSFRRGSFRRQRRGTPRRGLDHRRRQSRGLRPQDAPVMSGDLETAPFGESHGGLFRSFEKSGSGRYKLHAHVRAGDLTLR